MKMMSVRKAYGEALADYGALNADAVVLAADVSSSVYTSIFAGRFPKRFFNVGITEQAMIDVAAGLALGNMIPFANTFAALFLRTIEQIRTCVAYAKTNVKIVGGYSGLSDFKDGPTHHAESDIAMMRSLPNMVVLEAGDPVEAGKIVSAAGEYCGPVYIRLSRSEMPILFEESHKVEIGRGATVRDGNDVTLIGCGMMVSRCLTAADNLAGEGISARVIDMYTIKPLDVSLLMKAAAETGALVTVEEHSVVGGLGSAVAEACTEGCLVPIERIGIHDTFTETALNYEELLDHCGMAVGDIVEGARRVVKRRN